MEQRVAYLRVRDPMDIEDFVGNAAEQETEMEVASSDDLLSDSANPALLTSVQEDPEDVCKYDSEDAKEHGHSDISVRGSRSAQRVTNTKFLFQRRLQPMTRAQS